jgi:hypothetical protein
MLEMYPEMFFEMANVHDISWWPWTMIAEFESTWRAW